MIGALASLVGCRRQHSPTGYQSLVLEHGARFTWPPVPQRKTAPPGWNDGAADGCRVLEGDYRGPSGAFLRGGFQRVCVLVHRC